MLESLTRLARDDVTAGQFTALDELRRETVAPGSLDALALADRESELATWLEAHGVSDPWELASGLAAGGIDPAWCERAQGALGDGALRPGLEWVSATISSESLLGELKESTVRRISELVAAVRSYSQIDRASRQRVDVREGLDSTLTMLGHKLRDGVTVLREYGDGLPEIDAYGGELNQVWTNLIDNAVDAMDGRGRSRSRPAPRVTGSSSRSPTPARGWRPRWRLARSSPSSPPRTSAVAPGSASTSPAASSSSGTVG